MPISTETRIRVARADIMMGRAFSMSAMFWQEGKQVSHEVNGDCVEDMALGPRSQLHVDGNLAANLKIDGHHELIVQGNVAREAEISCSGTCNIFIGGNFDGTLESSESVRIWIEGDCSGSIKTGSPSTSIRIGGDFSGTIAPMSDISLLDLTIDGFATNESLSLISNLGYAQFSGAVGRSNVEPGIYPTEGHLKRTERGNSFNRWSVESFDEV